jgi:hypothetical protein
MLHTKTLGFRLDAHVVLVFNASRNLQEQNKPKRTNQKPNPQIPKSETLTLALTWYCMPSSLELMCCRLESSLLSSSNTMARRWWRWSAQRTGRRAPARGRDEREGERRARGGETRPRVRRVAQFDLAKTDRAGLFLVSGAARAGWPACHLTGGATRSDTRSIRAYMTVRPFCNT